MQPLDIVNYYKKAETDLIADAVLQKLHALGTPVPTTNLVTGCLKDGISSPATTHAKIEMLKSVGYIKEYNHPTDKDTRKVWIKVGARGELYLERWMK
jgi:hypothetical protein